LGKEYSQLNEFLVKVFNEILRTEEASFRNTEFRDLSMKEMHIVETVCNAALNGKNSSSEIAVAQRITAGTLTTTIDVLEKKGYVIRTQDDKDKRIIRILPTEKGIKANETHSDFHHDMVTSIIDVLNEDELNAIIKGLDKVQKFFRDKQN
jgi:DNA-binding MarR family transcriptional regulator